MSTAFIISADAARRPLAPAGTHLARCVWMLDLGTQRDVFQGREETARKLLLGFELPNETHTYRDGEEPEPFVVSREFRRSLHAKAALRAFLEGWRGQAFTDEDLRRFDLGRLAGKPCMLSIVHKTSASSGRTRAVIQSAGRLVKGMDCPPQVRPTTVFSLDDDALDIETFERIPAWIRDKITASPEYQELTRPNHAADPVDIVGNTEDEDIPF